jgi:hypothetical protein
LKRARPDIFSVIVLLCTRVKKPTEEDKRKLRKVLGYLIGTEAWIMKLKPRGIYRVKAYIDASFSDHLDRKSHSGVS